MNTPKCPACGRVMTRYGHSASGAQRWRCSLCNISQVSRINSTAKHLDVMCPGYCGECLRPDWRFGPSILMNSWPGCSVGAVRRICLAGAARFVGAVSHCGSYGRLARSSMRFMRSSSLTVFTWAEAPLFSSLKLPIVCWVGMRLGVRIPGPGARS